MTAKWPLLLLLFLTTSSSSAQDKEDSGFESEIDAVLLKHPLANFCRAEVDAGQLPAGKSGKLTIHLKNMTGQPVTLVNPKANCSCLNVKSTSEELKDGAIGEISLTISVPEKLRTAKGHASLSFASAGREEPNPAGKVEIDINYRVAGMISTGGYLAVLEIPDGDDFGEVAVPLIITAPIRKEDLEIKTTDTLRDVAFEIKSTDSGAIEVVGSIPSVMLRDGPVSGEVVIKDKVTGRYDGFFCTAKLAPTVRLAPNYLRFKELANPNEGLRFESNLILRVPPASSHQNSGENEAGKESRVTDAPIDDISEIACSLDEIPVQLARSNLGDNSVRIKVWLTEEQIRSKGPLIWSITFKGKSYAISTAFSEF